MSDGPQVTLPFSQLLAGLLTVVAQDVEVTITSHGRQVMRTLMLWQARGASSKARQHDVVDATAHKAGGGRHGGVGRRWAEAGG